eukprot:TRINITY_DN7631_c0_g2_i1.p2 TRINITY_DN7631_c0_g2~~TRINITY_DN7631_c0_g2_i1.p2  ORF type:complete len:138 (+),score=33.95 TRINITY_DN7631_c0_g2_i1:95-508(+)
MVIQSQRFQHHVTSRDYKAERLELALETSPVTRVPPAGEDGSILLGRLSARSKMSMAASALTTFLKENEFGFEKGMARVRGNVVTLWIEECYSSWSVEYRVDLNGTAVEVTGSREEHLDKCDAGPEFDTPLLLPCPY